MDSAFESVYIYACIFTFKVKQTLKLVLSVKYVNPLFVFFVLRDHLSYQPVCSEHVFPMHILYYLLMCICM